MTATHWFPKLSHFCSTSSLPLSGLLVLSSVVFICPFHTLPNAPWPISSWSSTSLDFTSQAWVHSGVLYRNRLKNNSWVKILHRIREGNHLGTIDIFIVHIVNIIKCKQVAFILRYLETPTYAKTSTNDRGYGLGLYLTISDSWHHFFETVTNAV